jgi:hypothetical protein
MLGKDAQCPLGGKLHPDLLQNVKGGRLDLRSVVRAENLEVEPGLDRLYVDRCVLRAIYHEPILCA